MAPFRPVRSCVHKSSSSKGSEARESNPSLPDFRFRPRNPSSMCRPSGALGWVGHGLSTASPRRPTEAACILYAFFGKAKQCPERGAGALLRNPASHSFLVPLRRNAGSSRQARQIGPPFENRTRPAPGRQRRRSSAVMPPLPGHGSHLEAYGCYSLRGCGPHGGGRVCACPSAVTLKAAVSRAAESDCQTDRTRRLSAVIRRRDRSGSSRPRSERRASTVPAAALKNRRRLGLLDLLSS